MEPGANGLLKLPRQESEFSAECQAVVLLVGVAVLRVAGAHVGLVQRVGGVMRNAVGLALAVGLLAGVQRGFLHEAGCLQHQACKIRG